MFYVQDVSLVTIDLGLINTFKCFQGPCQGDSGGPLYINYGQTPDSRIQVSMLQAFCLSRCNE